MLLILSQTLWSVNANLMQTESRTSSLFECYAEVQPILCKDIDYLRNRNDLSHNNSKSTIQHRQSRQFLLWQAAQPITKLNIAHCATIQNSELIIQNS